MMQNAAREGAAPELLIGDLDNCPFSTFASRLQIFELRCWARAYLMRANILSLHEAVDRLAADAARDGIDTDEAQAIIGAAFGAFQ